MHGQRDLVYSHVFGNPKLLNGVNSIHLSSNEYTFHLKFPNNSIISPLTKTVSYGGA